MLHSAVAMTSHLRRTNTKPIYLEAILYPRSPRRSKEWQGLHSRTRSVLVYALDSSHFLGTLVTAIYAMAWTVLLGGVLNAPPAGLLILVASKGFSH